MSHTVTAGTLSQASDDTLSPERCPRNAVSGTLCPGTLSSELLPAAAVCLEEDEGAIGAIDIQDRILKDESGYSRQNLDKKVVMCVSSVYVSR